MIKVASNVKSMLEKRARNNLLNIGNFNPFENQLANYGVFAGGGGLTGAGIGAIVNALRGESKLKGALVGGGIGAGIGISAKGFADSVRGAYGENLPRIFRDDFRSGKLERMAKELDAAAREGYKERSEDTWSNFFKNVWSPPRYVRGDENQKLYEEAFERLASKKL